MVADARIKEAVRLRAEGLSLREIGERLGCDKERVRQLLAKAERLEREQQSGQPLFELSVRTQNCILNRFGVYRSRQEEWPTVAQIAAVPESEWAAFPNLGKQSLAELQEWLKRHHE